MFYCVEHMFVYFRTIFIRPIYHSSPEIIDKYLQMLFCCCISVTLLLINTFFLEFYLFLKIGNKNFVSAIVRIELYAPSTVKTRPHHWATPAMRNEDMTPSGVSYVSACQSRRQRHNGNVIWCRRAGITTLIHYLLGDVFIFLVVCVRV